MQWDGVDMPIDQKPRAFPAADDPGAITDVVHLDGTKAKEAHLVRDQFDGRPFVTGNAAGPDKSASKGHEAVVVDRELDRRRAIRRAGSGR